MVLSVSYVGDGRGPVMGGFTKTAQGTGILSKAKSWFSGFRKMVKSVVSPVVKSHNTTAVGRIHAPVVILEMAPVISEGESVSSEHGTDIVMDQCVDSSNYKPELPVFSGKEDWQGYYSMFCAAADLAQWNDNRCFVELWLKLQGEAAEVCADVFSQPGLPSFQALANALRDRFEASGIDKVPVERGECNGLLMPVEIERGRARTRELFDGGLESFKTMRCVQDIQQHARCFLHVSPQRFQRSCPMDGERLSMRSRGRGSLARPRGDRAGGRGWRGSVQEPEGELGQWPTPENAIREENKMGLAPMWAALVQSQLIMEFRGRSAVNV